MLSQRIVYLSLAALVALAVPRAHSADSGDHARRAQANAKLRPIGTPGLVDSLRRSGAPVTSTLQQTAHMQASDQMGLPPSTLPSTRPSAPVLPPSTALPSTALPSTALPSSTPHPVPLDTRSLPQTLGSDAMPIRPPELAGNMATVDNCACVSAPSGYNAGGLWGCSPAYAVQPSSAVIAAPATIPYAPPPATIQPAVVMPGPYAADAGCKPLITLGQDPYNVQLGRGIVGQPKAYVPGQSVRNFIRYFTP